MRKKPCPICQVLRGKKPGKGKLCTDCGSNQNVQNIWQELQMLETIAQTNWTYRFLFPILLACGHGSMFFRDGWSAFKFGAACTAFTAWGLYFFNLLYMWPKNNLRLSDMRERKKKAFDKLFVNKVAGVKSPS